MCITTNAVLLSPTGTARIVVRTVQITLGSTRKRLRARESPALAFGIHYSVFKERQALTLRRWCRCPVARDLPVYLGPVIVGVPEPPVKGLARNSVSPVSTRPSCVRTRYFSDVILSGRPGVDTSRRRAPAAR